MRTSTASILSCLSCLAALALTTGCSSPAGNGATDGPGACTPKTGFDVAVPSGVPAKDDEHVAMALDAGGDPRIAFVGYDPNGDGDPSDTALYFVAYDGDTCTWKAPVMVDTTGDLDDTRGREVTIARDPSNGALAIGYQVVDRLVAGSTQVMLAQSSDDGATWTTEEIARDGATPYANDNAVTRPTVAMRNGKTFFAYYETWIVAGSQSYGSDANTFHLMSRSGTSGPFTDMLIPIVSGATLPGAESEQPALAIDEAGDAGLVYATETDDALSNLRVCYFASNQANAVAVFDSGGTQNDDADFALAYDGNKPRIAATVDRGAADATGLWFAASDDGVTWAPAVQVPQDGGDGMGKDVALALDAQGVPSVAARRSSTSGGATCGSPKLATGTGLTSFTTCGPAAGDPTYGDGYTGDDVQLGFAPSGKRIMALSSTDDDIEGVIVWREP